ncbi:uncharacterized protein LOC106012145 [Aplysia californica]|uniref:Uncharacterized protein LOC106012145 n=1 Tax=Aplysia californica TaxID=6500 RepID=A0ABM1A2M7_APLCA|nr:uncharacterized protein LOC106012145 [Aplysia californica]
MQPQYGISPYNQGFVVNTPPPQPAPQEVNYYHHHQQQSAVPLKERWSKRLAKTAETVVPSVVACILLQAVAAFFSLTAETTFNNVIQHVRDFSDDKDHDQFVLQVVFNVFFSFAAVMCVPVIKNSGYSMIVMGGTVLLLFSTMSSSLVSTAKILVLPYGIFGACAVGLLQVGTEVAMLDYLNNRRGLAQSLSYLGVTVGQTAALLCFFFTDMIEDAQYDSNGKTRWQNNLRVVEVTAVIALMSGIVLRKPSHTLGKWPEVFSLKPFYALNIIYFFSQIGFSFFNIVATRGTDELDLDEKHFSAHPILAPFFIYIIAQFAGVIVFIVGASCCTNCCQQRSLVVGGIAAMLLAGASFAHTEAFDELWQFAVYTGGAGVVSALVRVSVPLSMIYYTGRDNYKIALPFLKFTGGLGGLVAYLIQANPPDDMGFSDSWYACGALLGVFGLGAVLTTCLFSGWVDYKAQGDEQAKQNIRAIENEAFIPDTDFEE